MSTKKIFENLDKNKDGKISWEEFYEAIHAFSPTLSSEEIKKMFMTLDSNGDGEVDITEFALCMEEESGEESSNVEEDLRNAFDLYDIDCDGKISARELHVVLTRLGENCTIEKCVEMVKAADLDGDGCVNFEEFKIMMNCNKK